MTTKSVAAPRLRAQPYVVIIDEPNLANRASTSSPASSIVLMEYNTAPKPSRFHPTPDDDLLPAWSSCEMNGIAQGSRHQPKPRIDSGGVYGPAHIRKRYAPQERRNHGRGRQQSRMPKLAICAFQNLRVKGPQSRVRDRVGHIDGSVICMREYSFATHADVSATLRCHSDGSQCLPWPGMEEQRRDIVCGQCTTTYWKTILGTDDKFTGNKSQGG